MLTTSCRAYRINGRWKQQPRRRSSPCSAINATSQARACTTAFAHPSAFESHPSLTRTLHRSCVSTDHFYIAGGLKKSIGTRRTCASKACAPLRSSKRAVVWLTTSICRPELLLSQHIISEMRVATFGSATAMWASPYSVFPPDADPLRQVMGAALVLFAEWVSHPSYSNHLI